MPTNTYLVSVLVRYQVQADSENQANEIVSSGSEFPLVPWDENNRAVSDTITKIERIN